MEDLEGKTLDEILDLLKSSAQKDYLFMRILGAHTGEALRLVGRQPNAVSLWRRKNPQFREIEHYLISRQSKYKQEVMKLFTTRLQMQALMALEKLVEKGLNFEDQNDKEKKYIMKALEICAPLKSERAKMKEQKGNYEIEVFRRFEKDVAQTKL